MANLEPTLLIVRASSVDNDVGASRYGQACTIIKYARGSWNLSKHRVCWSSRIKLGQWPEWGNPSSCCLRWLDKLYIYLSCIWSLMAEVNWLVLHVLVSSQPSAASLGFFSKTELFKSPLFLISTFLDLYFYITSLHTFISQFSV